jgi:hypothetical protein
MYKEGYQYRTLNVHRSAISSVLPQFDGVPVGQLPIVKVNERGPSKETPFTKISVFMGSRFSP